MASTTSVTSSLNLQLSTFATTFSTQLTGFQDNFTTQNLNVTGELLVAGSVTMNDVGVTDALTCNYPVIFASTQDYVPQPPNLPLAALIVEGGVGLSLNLNVGGLTTLAGGIAATGSITGPEIVASSLATNTCAISGSGTVALTIAGTKGGIDASGNISGSGVTTITGLSTLSDTILVNTNNFVVDISGDLTTAGTFTASGTNSLIGNVQFGSTLSNSKITIDTTTGNIVTSGSSTISGNSYLNGGISTTTGDLSITSTSGIITFNNNSFTNSIIDNSTNIVSAGTLFNGTTWSVALSGSAPSAGQVLYATSSSSAQWESLPSYITGPGSSTTNGIALYGNTSGSTLISSAVTIDTNSNLNMGNSTATSNNIYKGGNIFIHNYNNSIGIGDSSVGSGNLSSVTGTLNYGLGPYALQGIQSSAGIVAIGYESLRDFTTGAFNIAIGRQSFAVTTTSIGCIGIGTQSLDDSDDINANIGIGYESMFSCSNSNQNTAIGNFTLMSIGSGSYNTAIGYKSLYNSGGSYNLAIGNNSAIISGSNNIYIGSQGIGNDNGVIRIGSSQTTCYIAGIYGNNVGGAQLLIDVNGNLGTVSSSIKFKEDIEDMDSNNLLKLNPVTFNYKEDTDRHIKYGLIAEEVNEIYPELVVRDKEGEIYSVQYHNMVSMILDRIQYNNKIIMEQEEEIRKLEK